MKRLLADIVAVGQKLFSGDKLKLEWQINRIDENIFPVSLNTLLKEHTAQKNKENSLFL